jgi:hypothetical protein
MPPPEMCHPRQLVALRVLRAGFGWVEVTDTVVDKLEMYEGWTGVLCNHEAE